MALNRTASATLAALPRGIVAGERYDVFDNERWYPDVKRYCPNCHFHWAWKLSDGRFKCRQCGYRYTFRSVWQSSRLPDRQKLGVLHEFSDGSAFSRSNGAHSARDRFIRLVRMTIAFHEHYCDPFKGITTGVTERPGASRSPSTGDAGYLVLGMHNTGDAIRVVPVLGPDGQRLVTLAQKAGPSGGLYHTTDRHAFGVFSIQDRMVVANEVSTHDARHLDRLETFWEELQQEIARRRKIPVQSFHLTLAEVSFRFHNHRQSLYPLIVDRIKHTPVYEIKRM